MWIWIFPFPCMNTKHHCARNCPPMDCDSYLSTFEPFEIISVDHLSTLSTATLKKISHGGLRCFPGLHIEGVNDVVVSLSVQHDLLCKQILVKLWAKIAHTIPMMLTLIASARWLARRYHQPSLEHFPVESKSFHHRHQKMLSSLLY